MAAQGKAVLPADSPVGASVGIGKREDGTGFGLVVELRANPPGVPADQAADLMRRADAVNPYSHVIRGNVQVTPSA